jgi:transcriptional regulator with XRE-family HTH domain
MSKSIKIKDADARNSLRRMRESSGLTMRQAGGLIGISHVSISQFENQKLDLPEYRIEQMVKAYGFTMDDFSRMTGRVPVMSSKDDCHAMIDRLGDEQLSALRAVMVLLLSPSLVSQNLKN